MDNHRFRAASRARQEFLRSLRGLRKTGALRERLAAARIWLRPVLAFAGGLCGAPLGLWGCYPFGLALCAAGFGGRLCLPAGMGALLSYMILGGRGGACGAAATAGLLIAHIALRDRPVRRFAWLGSCLAAGLQLAAGAGRLLVAPVGEEVLLLLCAAVLSGGLTLLLRVALQGPAGEIRDVARVAVGAAAFGALGGVELAPGLGLGGLCVGLCALWLCLFRRDMGVLLALWGGLLLDALAQRPPAAVAVFCVAAISAAVLQPLGRAAACGAWMLSGAACALWAGDFVGEVVCAGAAALFLPLPAEKPRAAVPALRAQSAAESRLDSCAEAYDAVCAALRRDPVGKPQNTENPADILCRAAEEACAACPRSPECWGREYQSTRDLLCGSLAGLMARGRVLREDLPPAFSASCLRFAEFLSALNRELCLYLYHNRLRAALEESREILCAQYGDFARLLRGQAAAVGRAMHFDPRAERRLMRLWSERGLRVSATVYRDEHGRLFAELEGTGTARITYDAPREVARITKILGRPMMLAEMESAAGGTRLYFREFDRLRLDVEGVCGRAAGQKVSGDRTAFLRLRSGRCYVIFSDGMGHGEEAAAEARRALQMLESHLRAGVTAELALRIVTGALLLRDGGTAFATVDMLEFDPVSGAAALYKCGAAPTWLCRAGTVQRFAPAGEPAGLSLSPPAVTRVLLRAGDRLLMVSDGISDGEEDEWISETLAAAGQEGAEELARRILSRCGAGDDRTVIALAVSSRGQA